MLGTVDHPHHVARTIPSTSPTAQPVRQCRVAEIAVLVGPGAAGELCTSGVIMVMSFPLTHRQYTPRGYRRAKGTSAHAGKTYASSRRRSRQRRVVMRLRPEVSPMMWWHDGSWGAGQWVAMTIGMVLFWGLLALV